jgi:hypothetical protein
VIDLCRKRDYADTPSDVIAKDVLRTVFLVLALSGLSA